MLNRIKKLKNIFEQKFSDTGLIAGMFAAPGRVNIIGEHTDYNDGFVLPVAINRNIIMAAQLRTDKKIKIYSEEFDQKLEFDLNNISRNEKNSWSNYILGVIKEFQKRGKKLQGINIAFTGDIPIGSGLSSSAALEVAAAVTIANMHNINITKVKLALLCKRAENDFVGVASGIMDQYISALGQKNRALFIDCKSNQFEAIPFVTDTYKIVMCDTRVKRKLVDSEYNQRRKECKEAVLFYKENLRSNINSLRDVNKEEMEKTYDQLFNYSAPVAKRARHVITENIRVKKSVEALREKDFVKLGKLMNQSHSSLSNDFEVSCKELDLIVELARGIKGTIGARMTGAGFGGVTVNLVHRDYLEKFKKIVRAGYEKKVGKKPYIYISDPENGAKSLKEFGENDEY